jgi:hypothetical protein
MSFFDSDIVRSELAEISDLQERIYGNVFKFSFMSKEEKLQHVDLLYKLLDTQQVLYARLKLSDDPKAQEMKKKIHDSASLMGLPTNCDVGMVIKNMAAVLQSMREKIDSTGSDV